jgi:outer membrane protein
MRKNASLLINAIMAIAIVILFVLVLNQKPNTTAPQIIVKNGTITKGKLPIAYINIDSLLLNYQFAKEANISLVKKQESSRSIVSTKAGLLQKEMAEFQKKLENNAFLSRERAEQEQVRLQKKQQELQQLDAKLSQQLGQEQQKMSEELRDTINKFMKEYNKNNKYEMIISNTSSDNILYAAKGYNNTKEISKLLNERFSRKK